MSYPNDGSDDHDRQSSGNWQPAPEPEWQQGWDPAAPQGMPGGGYSPPTPSHGVGAEPWAVPGEQPTGDEPTMGLAAHLGGLLTGFLAPLVVYLVKQDSPYVRHHATEALNFQLTLLIAWFVSAILMFVLVGFVLIFAVGIVSIVLSIRAAVAANRGEWYRYPINIRMVS